MAITARRRPRQRRLRVMVGVAVLIGAGLLSYATPPGPMSARADPPRVRVTCPPERCPPPSPPRPVASISPCDPLLGECPASPSPSPSIVVISPVPLDSPSPPTTPSYLIGRPSPSPSAAAADTGGPPVPLGGGFADLPTPSSGAVSSISDSGNRGDGLPLPLLLLGFLFVAGVAGALIYALAPRGERFPERNIEAPGGSLIGPGSDSPELKFRRPRSSG
jgi:hypothetical protein